MNADAFRHLYEYHFSENRKVLDACAALTHEQLIQPAGYSRGPVRDQVLHLFSAEIAWFSELRGGEMPDDLDPAQLDDLDKIRACWAGVEQDTRAYLAGLRDEMLFEKPIDLEEDKDLILWQVLLHVVNHATDHRAQILRQLNEFGIKTGPQDYIFYVYDHMDSP